MAALKIHQDMTKMVDLRHLSIDIQTYLKYP
jgi:hypothetical protein